MLGRTRLPICFGLLLALGAGRASAEALRPVRSASFDWDDNVVTMTTQMYLKKKGGGEVAMTTAKWAEVQHLVGKPGPYQDLYVQHDGADGTYRDMGDQPGRNPFLDELKKTIAGKAWRGPAWDAFVEQLSTPGGARRTSIITAREHSAENLLEGLKYLKKCGLIRYVPPKSQLFAVNRPDAAIDGERLTGHTPARKLLVQKTLLDRLESASQHDRGRHQTWHFSDDDWANYSATVEGLTSGFAQKRWPNVDAVVHFTGRNNPAHPPRVATLAGARVK